MNNNNIKEAGYGRRILSYIIELAIVVIITGVLYGNVTSTFMFNALGGDVIQNTMNQYGADTGLFDYTEDNNGNITILSYKSYSQEPTSSTSMDSNSSEITVITQEEFGYELYLQDLWNYYTNFLYEDPRAVTMRESTTSGSSTTYRDFNRPILFSNDGETIANPDFDQERANLDYILYFDEAVLGLPEIDEDDYGIIYESEESPALYGNSEYFRYSLDEDGRIDFYACPVLRNDVQALVDNGQDATITALTYFFQDTSDVNRSGIYMNACNYALGTDTTGEQTYYYSRYASMNYFTWLCFVPIYVPLVFIMWFVVPLFDKRGRTLGKYITRLEVVGRNGFYMNWRQRILRPLIVALIPCVVVIPDMALGITLYVLLAVIDYIAIILTKSHQSLHDKLTGTICVDARESLVFKNVEEMEAYAFQHPGELAGFSSHEQEEENRRIMAENSILDLSTIDKHRKEAREMVSFDEFERQKDEEERKKSEEYKAKNLAQGTQTQVVNLQKDESEDQEEITSDKDNEEETSEEDFEKVEKTTFDEDGFTDASKGE